LAGLSYCRARAYGLELYFARMAWNFIFKKNPQNNNNFFIFTFSVDPN